MAEKKVSVRLVAEGGRRVRAELEGVGEAGARGFGRMSREMELANVNEVRRVVDLPAAIWVTAREGGLIRMRPGAAPEVFGVEHGLPEGLVHVHLKPGGFSGADLTALFLNRLDALATSRRTRPSELTRHTPDSRLTISTRPWRSSSCWA